MENEKKNLQLGKNNIHVYMNLIHCFYIPLLKRDPHIMKHIKRKQIPFALEKFHRDNLTWEKCGNGIIRGLHFSILHDSHRVIIWTILFAWNDFLDRRNTELWATATRINQAYAWRCIESAKLCGAKASATSACLCMRGHHLTGFSAKRSRTPREINLGYFGPASASLPASRNRRHFCEGKLA